MEAYSSFAEVYDLFMDNVPYEEWNKYLVEILKNNGIEDGLVLELGCGTGKMTRLLEQAGYDMIGLDLSEDMLGIAMEQKNEDSHILYLNQDMREFELYGTVRAVVSICDSMNYITEEEDFIQVLKLVNNYLDPGGLFIFDLNTVYKYSQLLGETTICENREESSFIWDNYYDEEDQMNEYELTLFIRGEDGRFDKYEETHFQRAYELSRVREMIEQAGMEFVTIYDAFTTDSPQETSERVYVIARERGK